MEINMQKKYSLTASQYDIWIDQKIKPNSSLYNIGGCWECKSKIEYHIYNQVVNYLLEDNDVLRIHLGEDNGEPYQVIMPYEYYQVPFMDFSQDPAPFQNALAWMNEDYRKYFPLENHSLCQIYFLKVADNHSILFSKFHHIIIDGWGISLLSKQAANYYNALINDEKLTRKQFSFIPYIEDDARYLCSEKHRASSAFWKERLQIVPDSLYSSSVFKKPVSLESHSLRKSVTVPFIKYQKLVRFAESL
jgi:hypothetical protein